jgi:lysophospholipase L1-like esterase
VSVLTTVGVPRLLRSRERPGRWWRITVTAAVCLGGLIFPPAPAGADPAPTYYLAIGASESVGVQPTVPAGRSERTQHGYSNDLLTIERARWSGLRLVQMGCPGITAVQAVDGGGRCSYPAGSQLATATNFMESHRNATMLVTVDLGFNDLRHCLRHRRVDQSCVDRALPRIRRALTIGLATLERAGGSNLVIVGLQHYDPYLAQSDGGDAEARFAAASRPAFDQLNSMLHALYQANGALVANEASAFDIAGDRSNLPAMCGLTWMCARAPFGPNVHPNRAGYRVIADAIASALDAALGPVPRPNILPK